MAAKDVKFGSDARTMMMEGVDILANAVKVCNPGPERPQCGSGKNHLARRASLRMG